MIDFFNAIEKHQSELKRKLEDAGPTEFRKSKVIKEVKEQDVIDKLDAEKVTNKLFIIRHFRITNIFVVQNEGKMECVG